MIGKYLLNEEYYHLLKWILQVSAFSVLVFCLLIMLMRKQRNKVLVYGLVVSLGGYALGSFLKASSAVAYIVTPFLKSTFLKLMIIYSGSIFKCILMTWLVINICRKVLLYSEGKLAKKTVIVASVLPSLFLLICEYLFIPMQTELSLEIPGTLLSRDMIGDFTKVSFYLPYENWRIEGFQLMAIAVCVSLLTLLVNWDVEQEPIRGNRRSSAVCCVLCGICLIFIYGLCVLKEVETFIILWLFLSASVIILMILKNNFAVVLKKSKSVTEWTLISISVCVFVCLLHYIFLFKDKKIIHDPYYGVRYIVNGENVSTLRVNVDMIGNEVITAISIVHSSDNVENKDAQRLYDSFPEDVRGMTRGVSYQSNKNEVPMHYLYQMQRGQGYFEMITLNFYHDDYVKYDMNNMYEYLGLSTEMSDGKITYEELINSETFRFKWIVQQGEFENNISFMQQEKYDFRNGG